MKKIIYYLSEVYLGKIAIVCLVSSIITTIAYEFKFGIIAILPVILIKLLSVLLGLTTGFKFRKKLESYEIKENELVTPYLIQKHTDCNLYESYFIYRIIEFSPNLTYVDKYTLKGTE